MLAINTSQNKNLAENIEIADNFWARLIGLLGRPGLEPGHGMALKPCNSVHTFFMRFPIDVIFTDRTGKIVHIEKNLRPFRAIPPVKGAYLALELPPGTIARTETAKGDQIIILAE